VTVRVTDKGAKRLARELAKRYAMDAGVLGPKAADTYPGTGVTVGEVFRWNEFGAGRTPARAPLGTWRDQERAAITRIINQAMGYVIEGRLTMREALERAELKLLGSFRAHILGRLPPPNAPETLAKKKGDIPLIDTRRLLYALATRVTER
jgi:hypothetical protein